MSSTRSCDWLEEEVIPRHLRDLGGDGRVAGTDDEIGRENVVPGWAGALANHYAVRGLGQNDLIFDSERLGPFRRKLSAVTRFDRGCPRCIHGFGHDDFVVDRATEVGTGQKQKPASKGPHALA